MNYSRKSYRYLLVGKADIDKPISDFQLISQNHFPSDTENPIVAAIRFLVPDDMKMTQKKGMYYSTTQDTRTLRELNAHLVVKINGRWKENPFDTTLDETQPYNVHQLMTKNRLCITPFGYLEEKRFRYFVNIYTPKCYTSNDTYNYKTYWEFEKEWKVWEKNNNASSK